MDEKKTDHTQQRRKLEGERMGLTLKRSACGFEYYITVNFFSDVTHKLEPAEVFIRIAKEGSTIAGFIEALAITISIALQYGVPWSVLYDKYIHQIFEPRDDESSSLVDAIGKTISEAVEKWKLINEIADTYHIQQFIER